MSNPRKENHPEAIAALDLTKPGLIEASAGTGKTYAIEHLVLRLLMETAKVELPNILVLTFTDKAASELKEKIRSRIAKRIAEGDLAPEILARLKIAHLNFDRAAIYTIHGFCQRVLRKYAFENNALFTQELVKNVGDMVQQVLHEEMRSNWLSEAGPGSPGQAAFRNRANALGLGPTTKWAKRLIDLVLDFNPQRGDVLLPDYSPDRVAEREAEITNCLDAIAKMFPNQIAGLESETPLIVRYRTVNFSSKTTRSKGAKILETVLRTAIQFRLAESVEIRKSIALGLMAKLGEIGLTGIRNQGFSFLMPNIDEYPNLPWIELSSLLELLDQIRTAIAHIEKENFGLYFVDQIKVVTELRAKAQAHLKANGFITYDSMIEDVCLALREKEERVLMLRQDYRFCLVDEFQDTDPLQWEIFRRVFLDSNAANPLYLIGDPKQAIYRFRGGDVFTYMEARKAMFSLSRAGKAQGFGLDTNYRSSGAMVNAYNAAFTHLGWFHALAIDPGDKVWQLPAEPDPLGYLPVKHGDLPIQNVLDTTGTPAPIILKDFSGLSPEGNTAPAKGPEKTAVKKRVNHWIASEIAALMANPDRLMIPDAKTGLQRPLDWGDICVLVRKTAEKKNLERVLSEAGIPVQVNRRAGLYQGDSAGQFLAVLESLEDPRDAGKHARALLTRFFRADGDAPIIRPPDSPHPFFEEWTILAARRRWQRLFHALLYKTGLLYRESLQEDGDRRIMDFIHLAQNLVREGIAMNLSLSALVLRVRDLRTSPGGAEEDVDMHRQESEGGKVVLMTMHVSKGLEFPVVYLACFSGNPPATYFKYRDNLNTVFNLNTDDVEAKRAYLDESEGEDRRLFYVALTRARYKMFVPILPKGGSGFHATGPLGGFVANAMRTAAVAKPELYHWAPPEDYDKPNSPLERKHLELRQGPPTIGILKGNPKEIPGSAAEISQSLDTYLSSYPREDILSLPEADFTRRRLRLDSYSYLVRNSHGLAAENVTGRFDREEGTLNDTVTSEVPKDTAATDSKKATILRFPGNALPRGKDIGNMFHEILEKIDFSQVLHAASPEALLENVLTRDLIHSCMDDYHLAETWRVGVAGIVWNTLRAILPDPAGGSSFCLAELKDLRPEMEFLFPYLNQGGSKSSDSDSRDTGSPDGYLWGFIDLVFRHNGRYYLLDWKSNHLDDYGPEELHRSMQESHYDLQYMLYSLALDKWLASLIPNYDYDTHFGGIFYAYLRGMQAPTEVEKHPTHPNGIFALRPGSEQMREEFPVRLAKAMNTSGGGRAQVASFLNRQAAEINGRST